MGDTLFFTTETPFSVLSSQGSTKYPSSLTLTNNDLVRPRFVLWANCRALIVHLSTQLEQLATTIPLLCLGLLGFAVATCLFVTQRLALYVHLIR